MYIWNGVYLSVLWRVEVCVFWQLDTSNCDISTAIEFIGLCPAEFIPTPPKSIFINISSSLGTEYSFISLLNFPVNTFFSMTTLQLSIDL